YRISGSKARVEKLCQALESGGDLVELSEHSPHDITGVLKHFLKELSAPVLPPWLYDPLMALAKDLQRPGEEKPDRGGSHPDPVQSMRDLLSTLPGSNYNTLRHLIAHLYRVAEKYEENKMSPNNLGIVFGPTLLRPGAGGDVSMACLLHSGYQAQLVEFLIQNYERVFGMDELPSSSSPGCENPAREAEAEEGEGLQSPKAAQATLESSSSRQSFSADRASENSSPRDATTELSPEGPPSPSRGDAPEVTTSSELEDPVQERMDGDPEAVPGTQPRCHFSRQPVKYIRTQAKPKPVPPRSPRLPLRATTSADVATELGREGNPTHSSSTTRELLEESARSGSSSADPGAPRQRPAGRQQLSHFEMTQETARIISKIKAEDTSTSPESSLEGVGAAEKAEAGTYL
ncbi:PREDICTED: GEM-interacting protein-like, partial [Merops nubicus]|uniref:GEM-interacting protein-like n=1 Tax=Merops nubicus TaxID=57421 RepID=UPI0004F04B9E